MRCNICPLGWNVESGIGGEETSFPNKTLQLSLTINIQKILFRIMTKEKKTNKKKYRYKNITNLLFHVVLKR